MANIDYSKKVVSREKVDFLVKHVMSELVIDRGLIERCTVQEIDAILYDSIKYNLVLPMLINKIREETETKEEKLGYVNIYDNWWSHLLHTTRLGKIKFLRRIGRTGFTTVPRFHNTYITNSYYNECPHMAVDYSRDHVVFLIDKEVK